MKILSTCLLLILLNVVDLEAFMSHQRAPITEEWAEENLFPFDELMMSWNAIRPVEGKFNFYIRVKTDQWSPWLLYASWGNEGQSSFLRTSEESSIRIFQDTLEVKEGKKATAFHVKIITEGCSDLKNIYALHVYTNSDKDQDLEKVDSSLSTVYLKVPGISQMALNHIRYRDLCSPASTASVVRYLSNNHKIDAVDFAQQVWDSGFDIFGNWVFNAAQASACLGPNWNCWVERLNGFNSIYQYLKQGIPVVVSIRGPLKGSAQAYSQGHLLVVIGYDSLNQKVMCMDPAFPLDHQTHVYYDFSDFVQAWNRRGNLAYVFDKIGI